MNFRTDLGRALSGKAILKAASYKRWTPHLCLALPMPPTVLLSAKNTTVWLPCLDDSDTESETDSLFENELPTFAQAVATFIAPRLTIKASRDLTITEMTVKLTQNTDHSKTTLVQWTVNSVRDQLVQPTEGGAPESFPVRAGSHHLELSAFIDSTLPETVQVVKKPPQARHAILGQRRKKPLKEGEEEEPEIVPPYLVYLLEVSWSKKKFRNPLGKPVAYSYSIPFHLRRQPIDTVDFPIVLSSAWPQRADTSYLYSSRIFAFDEKVRASITISPLSKTLRLTSVHFAIKENQSDPIRVLNIYCQHHMTPELLEHHENELENMVNEGYEYKQHFLDTCCKGNLLNLGSDHTDLSYEFSLSNFKENINPSTKGSHPAPTTHYLQTTLRFSLLEAEGMVKKRRFFDHNISTPVTLYHRENATEDDSTILASSEYVRRAFPEKHALPAYEE